MGSLEARRVAEGDRAGSIILHALVISFTWASYRLC